MPGFLSSVFEDGGSQSAGNAQSVSVADQFDVDESFTVGGSQSIGFTDMNGTDHEFSNSQEITVDVSADALVGAGADTSQGIATSGLDG